MIKLMASIFFILSHATMSLLATDQDKDMTLIPMDVVGKLQEAMLVCFKKINCKYKRVSRIHKESYHHPLGELP